MCQWDLKVLLVCLALAGFSASASADDWPEFDEPALLKGRTIWLGTCEGCHGIGVAGAPVASNFKAWQPRIAKGKDVLYEHAIEGFFGPKGTMMPARGGNDSLSNEEVKLAVDYMVKVAAANQ